MINVILCHFIRDTITSQLSNLLSLEDYFMVDSNTEYNALRSEILNLISIQNTYIIAMYTITVTILGIGLQTQNSLLFLLPYTVLFSFQRTISAKRDGYLRIAAYIAVYLEEGSGWESKYATIISSIQPTKHNNKFVTVINNIFVGRISSSQLGILCSSISIIMASLNITDNNFPLTIATILSAVVLLLLLLRYNKNTLKSMKKREEYIQLMKSAKQLENIK